jgi:hypothetical protein
MKEQLYSTIDAARLLGVPEHRLNYAHRTGQLPAPTFLIAGKNIYTSEDVEAARRYFRNRKPWTRARRNDEQ